ncbi:MULTISPECIES: TetR/AcrR family transcriptional regulator [Streptomyces]|uniref:TetR family transcriptional regulator n=1 Tax=Streptomyces cacaoi TaxID=1898 RepID=A0A4Y3QZR3_STRCI|nr:MULTISPECIES: TetR/AcrR family transcriptional regulator [Streptomyces]NNG83894.1 TetR/AcrR family transcriptional regulator [Streptomyces cacaoi]GEB50137.1 TetR family transcriptional regulator [Streptomyces cacaoi]
MPDVKHFDPQEALERAERVFWQHGSAAASVQVLTAATGLNRSSLYATFGSKQELYLAALRHYIGTTSHPAFRALAEDERGLPAVRDFFDGLITLRCTGPYAGWGCMVVNAQAGTENADPQVRAVLAEHHTQLCAAFRTALETARAQGQLSPDLPLAETAESLALLAYGVNLHSRSGATADTLRRTTAHTLDTLTRKA